MTERDWLIVTPPTCRSVLEVVGRYTSFAPAALTGPCRDGPLVSARQLAMWLCRELRPDLSYPQLGRAFNRDHTTVIYGCRQAAARLGDRDPKLVWLEVSRGAFEMSIHTETRSGGALAATPDPAARHVQPEEAAWRMEV